MNTMKTKIRIIIFFSFALIVFSCVPKQSIQQSLDFKDTNEQNGLSKTGTVTDVDNNVYKTVTIGTQVWMKENLKTTKYNDGTPIIKSLSSNEWKRNSTGAYTIYKNNARNNTTYGKLYNWYAVNSCKLCPKGWHIPTNAEWNILTTFIGGDAGAKMKSASSWKRSNSLATNESGFSALPGGERNSLGKFENIRYEGKWWSSTLGKREFKKSSYNYFLGRYSGGYDYTPVLILNLFSSPRVLNSESLKKDGLSVRCLKD